jgi:hypothetical protein
MNQTLKATCDFIREMSHHSNLKGSRGYADILADRIVQAGTQPNLLAFGERLCALMGVELAGMHERAVAAVLENTWTGGVAKEKRQLAIAKVFPAYADHLADDDGGDIADGIGIADWWRLERLAHGRLF